MRTKSIWEETKTFFPMFLDHIKTLSSLSGSVCVIGASDGKFIIPLATQGWNVLAVEADGTALNGGLVEFPKTGIQEVMGLRKRLIIEGFQQQVEIINEDLLCLDISASCPAVFTSCSWHYSRNHHKPVAEFINRMQAMVSKGGIFCAEYMMPCEPKHKGKEHYLKEGEIIKHFSGWNVLDDFYTAPFVERAHVGNLVDHIHRMGFFAARKL